MRFKTKSVIFLSIIICGFFIGQLIPFTAMFGAPAFALFTAFFVPYFGFKKCLVLVFIFSLVFAPVSFQTNIAVDLGLVSIAQQTGVSIFNEMISDMRVNMTDLEFEGNMSRIMDSSFYGVFVFITDSDPLLLAFLFEVVSTPIVKIGWFVFIFLWLRHVGFYKRVYGCF